MIIAETNNTLITFIACEHLMLPFLLLLLLLLLLSLLQLYVYDQDPITATRFIQNNNNNGKINDVTKVDLVSSIPSFIHNNNKNNYIGVDPIDVIITMLPNQEAVERVYLGNEGLVTTIRNKINNQINETTNTTANNNSNNNYTYNNGNDHDKNNCPKVLIDASTIAPSVSKRISLAVKQVNDDDNDLLFLDAPVSGGIVGAGNASLTFMVGGVSNNKDNNDNNNNKSDLQKDVIEPILYSMGSRIEYCGAVGSGQTVKVMET